MELPRGASKYTLEISTDNSFRIIVARGTHDTLYPQMIQLVKALPASLWVDMHSHEDGHYYSSRGEYKNS